MGMCSKYDSNTICWVRLQLLLKLYMFFEMLRKCALGENVTKKQMANIIPAQGRQRQADPHGDPGYIV